MGSVIKQKLEKFYKERRCTFLGIGPMSLNCTNVTIDLANKFNIPLFLIASRRQIDSYEFGGGYVNNWTTKEFANHIVSRDKKGKVLICRDHGGPWQNPKEVEANYGLRQAMESAKKSYLSDIQAGFQIIHIDPSIDIHNNPSQSEVLDRIFELYEYCWNEANKLNKNIAFEIGTEEQSGSTNTQDELEFTLSEVKKFCKESKIQEPTFVVVQCGTRVLETNNVGSFDTPLRVMNEIPAEIQLPKMLQICNKYNVMMKAHNTDYLSTDALNWHPRLGIHAVNVAPEFGVAETKSFLEVLNENNLSDLSEKFLKVSFDSKKWEKWLKPNSNLNDKEKAILSGHYVFSKPEFIDLKNEASYELKSKNINLDEILCEAISRSILRYISNFRLIS